MTGSIYSLRKKSTLGKSRPLGKSQRSEKVDAAILGGAALQRCDHCVVLNPALAAAVTILARE
jgi:hypothetical protein